MKNSHLLARKVHKTCGNLLCSLPIKSSDDSKIHRRLWDFEQHRLSEKNINFKDNQRYSMVPKFWKMFFQYLDV